MGLYLVEVEDDERITDRLLLLSIHQRLVNLTGRIDELEKNMTAGQDDLGTALAGLDTEVGTIAAAFAPLTQANADLQASVTALTAADATDQATIATLQAEVAAAAATVNGEVTKLQAALPAAPAAPAPPADVPPTVPPTGA